MQIKVHNLSGPILESKGMHPIFQGKGKKEQTNVKNWQKIGQNISKFGQKCTKFEHILKKGRQLCVITAHNKLLEKALSLYVHVQVYSYWKHGTLHL